jgi:hypothetical protein
MVRRKAGDFLAALEADLEYVRRRDEEQRRIDRYMQELHEAEAPVVTDLYAAGVRVESVWDLVNTRAQYPAALPILFEHLQRSYPPAVKAGIARALAVPEAKQWWRTFVDLFRSEDSRPRNDVKTALGVALSETADVDVVDDVIDLVGDSSHGEHRIVLLNVLARSSRTEAREALERAAKDPQLIKEARIQPTTAREAEETRNIRTTWLMPVAQSGFASSDCSGRSFCPVYNRMFVISRIPAHVWQGADARRRCVRPGRESFVDHQSSLGATRQLAD